MSLVKQLRGNEAALNDKWYCLSFGIYRMHVGHAPIVIAGRDKMTQVTMLRYSSKETIARIEYGPPLIYPAAVCRWLSRTGNEIY